MNNPECESSILTDLAAKALKTSIRTTFQVMLGVEVELQEPFTEAPDLDFGRSVAGVIGWAGNWRGTGVFSCKPASACKLAELMLGTSNPSLNEDSLDAVAEIANIIFGFVKTELEVCTSAMLLGTPTVVYASAGSYPTTRECFNVTPVRMGDCMFYVKLHFVKALDTHNHEVVEALRNGRR